MLKFLRSVLGYGLHPEYRKLADRIGPVIHTQLSRVMGQSGETLGHPEEMAFTYGYLSTFTCRMFRDVGCNDSLSQEEFIQYVCNGVIPGRLWDIFQRGKALSELSKDGEREEFKKTYEAYGKGKDAGVHDAQVFCDGGHADNLARFLLGQPLEA